MRRLGSIAVAVALVIGACATAPAAPARASTTEWCPSIILEAGARTAGDELAACLASRISRAGVYRTRIAATGDRSTVADVRLDPLRVSARRGDEHVCIGSRAPRTLLGTFVRRSAPPAQIVDVVRSVEWWQVVRRGSVLDADGAPRDVWRFEPVDRLRFDDASARSVSLHLSPGLVPIRFRATTTAVGFDVVYTQRWSRWSRIRGGT